MKGIDAYNKQQQVLRNSVNSLKTRIDSPEEQVLMKEIDRLLAVFNNTFQAKIVPNARRGYLGNTDQDKKEMDKAADGLVVATDQLINRFTAEAETTASESRATGKKVQLVILFATLGVIGVGLVLGLAITRDLVSPIQDMTGMLQNMALGELNRGESLETKGKVAARGDELGTMAEALRAMQSYMIQLADGVQQVAAGDLTLEIGSRSSQDVLGQTFSRMVDSLRHVVGRVAESVEQLDKAAAQMARAAQQSGAATGQISLTMQQVARGVDQQSSSLSEVANSMEQMTRAINGVAKGAQEQAQSVALASRTMQELTKAMDSIQSGAQQQVAQMETAAAAREDMGRIIAQVAQTSQQVSQQAQQVSSLADGGAEAIRETVKGMERASSATQQLAVRVKDLGKSAGKIGAIVETIDEIAAQTNLLALNAAIEAARAGEHGRGFAVVAGEVRKLAERSILATREIGDMVSMIRDGTRETALAMNHAGEDVTAAAGLADQSMTAFQEITGEARETASKMNAVREMVISMADVEHRLAVAIAEATRVAEANQEASKHMAQRNIRMGESLDVVSAVVEENTAATEQMTAGAAEVSQSFESVAAVSEQNTAAVEQVSASAEEVTTQVQEMATSAQGLYGQAKSLSAVISHFRLTGQKTDMEDAAARS